MINKNKYIYAILFNLIYALFIIYLLASSSLPVIGGGWSFILSSGAVIGIFIHRYPKLAKPMTMLAAFLLYLSYYNFAAQYALIHDFPLWIIVSIGVTTIIVCRLMMSTIYYPFYHTSESGNGIPEVEINIRIYIYTRLQLGFIATSILVFTTLLFIQDSGGNHTFQKYIIYSIPFYIIAGIGYVYSEIRNIPTDYLNLIVNNELKTDIIGLSSEYKRMVWKPTLYLFIFGLFIEAARLEFIFFISSYLVLVFYAYLFESVWKKVNFKVTGVSEQQFTPNYNNLQDVLKITIFTFFILLLSIAFIYVASGAVSI